MTDHPCKGMTKAQRETFERIAINDPPRATKRTLDALKNRNLIVGTDRLLGRTALGPIFTTDWHVPLPVHHQWCQWASEQQKARK